MRVEAFILVGEMNKTFINNSDRSVWYGVTRIAPGLTARRTGMLSLNMPRVTYVVAFLLFATGIGHVLVSGEASSHIKSMLYSPVTVEADHKLTIYERPILIGDSAKNEGNESIFFENSTRYIYTAGIPRTGSTFQQVLLCVIGHLRSDSVSCSGQKNSTLQVIKMHPSNQELRLTNSLLFTTVRNSLSEWSARNVTWTEGNVAYTQIYSRFVECPLCEVSKYRNAFGLTDVEVLLITQYMRYWSILRQCCGSQMSKHLRKELFGCPNSSDPLLEGKIDYHMCGSWNLTAVEKNFVKTKLYSIVPADRLARPAHLKLLWSKPGDCEASHDAVRNGVGFNLRKINCNDHN